MLLLAKKKKKKNMRGLHCSINIYQEKSLALIFKSMWHKNQVFQV